MRANLITSLAHRGRLCLAGWALLAILCAGGSARTASAQFSGPAVGVGTQGNVVQTPTTDPLILNPGLSDLTIASGDVLAIHLFGVPEYSPVVRVGIDGNVQLPLIGVVPVAGLTINRAEDLIAQRLLDAGMYRNPQVSLQVTEAANQFATVSGELHGIVPLSGDRRLLDVLAAVGSLPPTASHVITIIRLGVKNPIVIDLGTDPARSAQADIPILPHDTIIVPRVGVVYMLGAFHLQAAIPLQPTSPLTLMQATTLVGGIGFEGKYADLRIIRTTGLERREVKVDIKRILDGKNPDPVLQADDIVFLPSSDFKAAIKSGGLATLSNLASILILAFR